MKDYDFSIISIIDDSVSISDIKMLTEDEKKKMKEIIQIFNQEWQGYYYLEARYPETKYSIDYDGNTVYDGESFTFFNKFLSVSFAYEEKYLRVCNSIQSLWKKINEIIIWEIIPRYLKKNEVISINLEEILSLSRFISNDEIYDISKRSKTKKIERRLGKNK